MSDRGRNGDLEAVYAALAEGIDAHGPEHSEMFLAKAALLLAEARGDEDRALRAIADAQRMALDFTGGSPETIHTDMIRTALSSKARLAVAPMQDYLGLGSEARINVPGTSSNNWRWRVVDAQLTPEVCDNVAQMVSTSGRSIGQGA